jgi:hypothetical protein
MGMFKPAAVRLKPALVQLKDLPVQVAIAESLDRDLIERLRAAVPA